MEEVQSETFGDGRGRPTQPGLTLKRSFPSTFHFKARLENKQGLTGNSVIITVMKTTPDCSVMEKRQTLMSSEPSRMLLNISNTKMRDLMFSEGRALSPTPQLL